MPYEQDFEQSANGQKSMPQSGSGQGSGGGKGPGGGGGQGGGIGGGGLGDLPGEANVGLLTIDGVVISTSTWPEIELELTPNNEQYDDIYHGSEKRDTIK